MEIFSASCIDKTQAETPSFAPPSTPAAYPLAVLYMCQTLSHPEPFHLLLHLPEKFFSSHFTPWPPLDLQSNAICSWGYPWPTLTLEHYYSPFALYFYPWNTSPSRIVYKLTVVYCLLVSTEMKLLTGRDFCLFCSQYLEQCLAHHR